MKPQTKHIGEATEYLVSDDCVISYPLKFKLDQLLAKVMNINTKQLREIAAIRQPSTGMEMTFETIFVILGYELSSKFDRYWKQRCKILNRQRFNGPLVKDMMKVDITKITRKQFNKIDTKFIQNKYWNYERINRVSKVCGPIAAWIYFVHEILTTQNGLLTQGKVMDLTRTFCREYSCPFEIHKLIFTHL